MNFIKKLNSFINDHGTRDHKTGLKLDNTNNPLLKIMNINGIQIRIEGNFDSNHSFEKSFDDLLNKINILKSKYNLVNNVIAIYGRHFSNKVVEFHISDVHGNNKWGTDGPIPADIKEDLIKDINNKLSAGWRPESFYVNIREFQERGYLIVEVTFPKHKA